MGRNVPAECLCYPRPFTSACARPLCGGADCRAGGTADERPLDLRSGRPESGSRSSPFYKTPPNAERREERRRKRFAVQNEAGVWVGDTEGRGGQKSRVRPPASLPPPMDVCQFHSSAQGRPRGEPCEKVEISAAPSARASRGARLCRKEERRGEANSILRMTSAMTGA